jgi:hypothetical protein
MFWVFETGLGMASKVTSGKKHVSNGGSKKRKQKMKEKDQNISKNTALEVSSGPCGSGGNSYVSSLKDTRQVLTQDGHPSLGVQQCLKKYPTSARCEVIRVEKGRGKVRVESQSMAFSSDTLV